MKEDIYYKSAYQLISDLEHFYKKGFNINNIPQFIKKQRVYKIKAIRDKSMSTVETCNIALMGLNKESIEKTGNNTQYKDSIYYNPSATPGVISTALDSIIKVTKSPSQITEEQLIKKIRNGYLHSEFIVDYENNITTVKNKNYFEAEVRVDLFSGFTKSYFSNLEGLGITDKLIYPMPSFNINVVDINTLQQLLDTTFIITIEYKNNNIFNGSNSLEQEIAHKIFEETNGIHNLNQLKQIFLNNIDAYNLVNLNIDHVTPEIKENIKYYVDTVLGESFYNSTDIQWKYNVISHLYDYNYRNNHILSNSITNVSTVSLLPYISDFCDIDKEKEFYCDDILPFVTKESIYIVKLYLILYRLQHNDYEQIDYNNVSIDLKKITIKCFKESTPETIDNSIKEVSILKLKTRFKIEGEELEKAYIIEKIRNSSAHGNLLTTYTKEGHNIIFKDIEKGKVEEISMPFNTFKNILSSYAFNPNEIKHKTL